MSARAAARTPAIAGLLLAGAAVLLIGLLVGERGPAARDSLPPLVVVEPAAHAVVTNPVTVHFTTPAALRLTRDGWTAGNLHLHLIVDDRELMPAAADIVSADTAYAWRLPALPPGQHRLYLTWAARHHGNLAGPTDTITLHVTH